MVYNLSISSCSVVVVELLLAVSMIYPLIIDLDWFLLWALLAAFDYFFVDKIDSKKHKVNR